MTLNEIKIMHYLEGMEVFVSPTEIGLAVGGRTRSGIQRHSSWSSRICKSLVKKGLLERSDYGWYRPK